MYQCRQLFSFLRSFHLKLLIGIGILLLINTLLETLHTQKDYTEKAHAQVHSTVASTHAVLSSSNHTLLADVSLCLVNCSAPANTCSTNNGTYVCTPANCSTICGQSCTKNTCNTGYNCIGEQCFPPNPPNSISGTVTSKNPYSNAIQPAPNMTVTATSKDGKTYLMRVTDVNGNYIFTNLPTGSYDVAIIDVSNFYIWDTPNPVKNISVTSTGVTGVNFSFHLTGCGPVFTNRISGNVFVDANANAVWDNPPETMYTDTPSTVTLSGTDGAGNPITRGAVTVSDGFYTFGALPPGLWTVSYGPAPSGYTVTTPQSDDASFNGGFFWIECKPYDSPGRTQTFNFGIVPCGGTCPTPTPTPVPGPRYTISGNIYVDTDNNQHYNNPPDTLYGTTPSIVSISGPISFSIVTQNGSYTTGATLPAGTYTVSYSSLPSGYQMTYPVNGPPPSFSVTVGPSCNTNGANDATCPGPTITNTVTLDNANSAQLTGGNTTTITWNHTIGSQSNRFLVVGLQQLFNRPFVSVTYHNINLTRLASAAGTGPLYEEIWYLKDPGPSSLPGGTYPITATSSVSNNDWYAVGAATYYNVDQTTPFPPGSVVTKSGFSGISPISVTVPSNTTQLVTDVTSVELTSTTDSITPNSGQATIWNQHAIGPQVLGSSSKPGQSVNTTLGWSTTSPGAFWIDVGFPLNPSTSPGPPTGNITGLDFGITNNVPWFQAFCADIRQESNGGINDFIPASPSCGGTATTNMIMSNATCPNPANSGNGSNGNTNNIPGIAFTGDNSAYFGQGQASTNPFDCVVGGIQYSEVFTPVNSTVIRTSYSYMQTTARQSGLTPTDIVPYCIGGIGNCALSNTLPHGLYQATGALTLTGPGYTFGANQDYVILVNGDLTIQEPIHVPAGSTVTFSVAGDIHVDKSVGKTTLTSLTPDIEGLYSTDKSFFIDSYGQPGSVCNANGTPIDKKLNIQGAVVVNAAELGGTFQNNRNLCNQNPSCPTFTITSRPDMLLNAPQFIKHQQSLWQEIIP